MSWYRWRQTDYFSLCSTCQVGYKMIKSILVILKLSLSSIKFLSLGSIYAPHNSPTSKATGVSFRPFRIKYLQSLHSGEMALQGILSSLTLCQEHWWNTLLEGHLFPKNQQVLVLEKVLCMVMQHNFHSLDGSLILTTKKIKSDITVVWVLINVHMEKISS